MVTSLSQPVERAHRLEGHVDADESYRTTWIGTSQRYNDFPCAGSMSTAPQNSQVSTDIGLVLLANRVFVAATTGAEWNRSEP